MPLGLYISVPFCRTKCSYCNFASDVFSRAVFERYVERVAYDISHASETAEQLGGQFELAVDSIFLGGGTPTILDIAQLERLFVTISQKFTVQRDAEVTVECAPGTLNPAMIEALQRCGANRVSLGVQSFVDAEAASVGRLHKRATVLSGACPLGWKTSILIWCGLPTRPPKPGNYLAGRSLQALRTSASHAGGGRDSRLGRELMAGGTVTTPLCSDEGLLRICGGQPASG
jgi:oxygen-independent coproporphyrinogen-3 oxidase